MENIILHALLSFSFQSIGPTPPPTAHLGEECFGPLGCFSVRPPWAGTEERPVAVLPKPLNVTMPVFCLHTPSQPFCHKLLIDDMGSIYSSDLNRSAPLIFITHGYMETATLPWMMEMKDALLQTSPHVNVVTVDWGEAAHPPYAQAVTNIRVAGTATGYLLHMLVELYDVSLSSVHLVGHSLGAHFMSYAGDFVNNARGEKVARITGLDPAGPYFVNSPPEVGLDPSDAEFVDVIHTDIPKETWEINKLGHPGPIGHVDYYPNGGFNQAGCSGSAHAHIDEKKSIAHGVLVYIGCNHQRSFAFFTESILSQCRYLGKVCDSWEKYLSGSCWGCEQGECFTMGFSARPVTISPYINISEGNHTSGKAKLIHKPSYEYSNDKYSSRHDEVMAENGSSIYGGGVERRQSEGISSLPPHIMEEAPVNSKTVFLGTNSKTPFCAEQYRVSLITSSAISSQEYEGDVGRFTVRIRGQLMELVIPSLQKSSFIRPGEKLSWVGFSTQLGSLNALLVDYEEDQGLLHSLIFRFSPPTLYIDLFMVEELSTGKKTLFPFCGRRMQAGESYVLFAAKKCDDSKQFTATTVSLAS